MMTARTYQPGDEAGIVALINLAFPDFPFTLADWAWRHQNSLDSIVVALDSQGRVIGHWAFVKKTIALGEKHFYSGLTLAAVVHPDWRNQRIFSSIAHKVLDIAASSGVDFLYGFPNDISLPIHTDKLGFKTVKSYELFVQKVDPKYSFNEKNFPRHTIRRAIPGEIVPLSHFSHWYNLVKDQSYLRNRYWGNPNISYQIYRIDTAQQVLAGFFVLKPFPRSDGVHLQLIDIDVPHRTAEMIEQIHRFIYTIAINSKAEAISTWKQSLDVFEDTMIEQFSFRKDPSKVFHLAVKSVHTTLDMSIPWLIRMGDTEIF